MLTISFGDYFMWQLNTNESEFKKHIGEGDVFTISIYDNEDGEYLSWQLD